MAGTHSVLADDQRILGIPRSRQTVAIIYPQYSSGLQDFPHTSVQAPCETEVTPSLSQCSARAAQDIWEHHRPAVGSSMHVLWNGHSTSEKRTLDLGRLNRGSTPRGGACGPPARSDRPTASPTGTAQGLVGGRGLTRYRNQPDKSLHRSGAAMHHHPTDQERALNLSIPTSS